MSIQEKLVAKSIMLTLKGVMRNPSRKNVPIKLLRQGMELGSKVLFGASYPSKIEEMGGCDVTYFSSGNLMPNTFGKKPIILFIHGGAFIVCSPRTHAGFAGLMAQVAGADVHVPDYRLAPEFPYPSALNDIFATYSSLLGKGYSPQQIIVMGDSAGGGLTLALALYLKQQKMQQPAGLVMLSPWVDLSLVGASITTHQARDAMLSVNFLKRGALAYSDNLPVNDARVSPLFADLTGLAPMFIKVGSEEILLDDAQRLYEKATSQGVLVKLEIAKGMWHGYPLFSKFIPKARSAVSDIAAFVNQRVADL